MTINELITEFCSHFGYDGRLDNTYKLEEVKKWLKSAIPELLPTIEMQRKNAKEIYKESFSYEQRLEIDAFMTCDRIIRNHSQIKNKK